jgi:hypothetical protein
MTANVNQRLPFFLIVLLLMTWGCVNDTYPDPNKVILLLPEADEIMDNGCYPVLNDIDWQFTWKAIPGATSYQIHVMHEGSLKPVANDETTDNFWNNSQQGFILPENTQDWKWKVRAFKDGQWCDWSVERTYTVEPVNTDC